MPHTDNTQGPGLNPPQSMVRLVFLGFAILTTLVTLFVHVTVPLMVFAWLAFGIVVVAQVLQKRANGSSRGA